MAQKQDACGQAHAQMCPVHRFAPYSCADTIIRPYQCGLHFQCACELLWRNNGLGVHADTAPCAQVREAAEGGSEGRLFMAVDKELVAERVGELLKKQDLSKYVL